MNWLKLYALLSFSHQINRIEIVSSSSLFCHSEFSLINIFLLLALEFSRSAYSIIVAYGLIAIAAAFGLYVTTCVVCKQTIPIYKFYSKKFFCANFINFQNTPKLLSIYSKVFYGITGFNVFNSIMIIVETITSAIECPKLDNPNEYSYLCKDKLIFILPGYILSIILSVCMYYYYFFFLFEK